MNFIRIIFLCIVLCFLNLSCDDAKLSFSKITCKIPEYINIKDDEIYAKIKDFHLDPSSLLFLEITIYSYSTGLESISISDSGDIKNVIEPGKIKSLIKITDGKKVLRADFIDAIGNSKEEMISSLVDKIRVKLNISRGG
ncbi:MAG: hypothetical protein FWH53_08770 [Leptospirales bacterium]|nr:hypothetical protein [Leptospirales bacterium]